MSYLSACQMTPTRGVAAQHEQTKVEMIMSTHVSALNARDYVGASDAAVTGRPSRLSRWFDGFVKGQERAAAVRIAREIQHLSDDHLKVLGLSDDQIADLRSNGRLTVR